MLPCRLPELPKGHPLPTQHPSIHVLRSSWVAKPARRSTLVSNEERFLAKKNCKKVYMGACI